MDVVTNVSERDVVDNVQWLSDGWVTMTRRERGDQENMKCGRRKKDE